MPIQAIQLVRLRRRGVAEAVATMQVKGDGEPASFQGERVQEVFGRPTIHRGFLQDSDLRPEFERDHGGRARNVLRQITAGRAGRFEIDRNGQFLDYHGGHGFRNGNCLDWFTPDALRRGIGWYFIQTYRHGGRAISRYKVTRIISGRGIEVLKSKV